MIQEVMEPKARIPQRCSHISWVQSECILLPRKHYTDLVIFLYDFLAFVSSCRV